MFSAARWRLPSAFTVVLAVILLAAAIAVYLTTRSVLFARVDDDLEQRAVRDLSEFVGGPPHGGPPGEFVPPAKTTGGYFYAVVDGEGQTRRGRLPASLCPRRESPGRERGPSADRPKHRTGALGPVAAAHGAPGYLRRQHP